MGAHPTIGNETVDVVEVARRKTDSHTYYQGQQRRRGCKIDFGKRQVLRQNEKRSKKKAGNPQNTEKWLGQRGSLEGHRCL